MNNDELIKYIVEDILPKCIQRPYHFDKDRWGNICAYRSDFMSGWFHLLNIQIYEDKHYEKYEFRKQSFRLLGTYSGERFLSELHSQCVTLGYKPNFLLYSGEHKNETPNQTALRLANALCHQTREHIVNLDIVQWENTNMIALQELSSIDRNFDSLDNLMETKAITKSQYDKIHKLLTERKQLIEVNIPPKPSMEVVFPEFKDEPFEEKDVIFKYCI